MPLEEKAWFARLPHLATAQHHATTWPGTAVSAASLIVTPLLGTAKQRTGARLGSAAVRGEGTGNLICACLAAAVLGGLLANAALGLWPARPWRSASPSVTAVREGRETCEDKRRGTGHAPCPAKVSPPPRA